jgi:hypothetical protein
MILNGDCLLVLPTLEADSIDSCVTDPPYGLSFMGKDWDHGVPGEAFWREVYRVLKPGAHLVAFGGTRTHHRLMCGIEDAGFQLRDTLGWIFGSGFPKSHNLDGDWKGWGTALKPAWEPIVLARKPPLGTVAANVQRHGTGALNIDGCRVESGDALIRPAIQRHDNEVLGKGLGAGTQIEPLGRWPANIAHDGSEDVLAVFPDSTSTGGDGYKQSMFCGGKKTGGHGLGDSGSAARFFYCAKASKSDRNEGLEGMEKREVALPGKSEGYNPKTGEWSGSSEFRKRENHHPTVKPTKLMRWLCRLVTPPGGLILDPFMGSGSTGKAALAEGFRFVGIELQPEYCAIAEKRMSEIQPELKIA